MTVINISTVFIALSAEPTEKRIFSGNFYLLFQLEIQTLKQQQIRSLFSRNDSNKRIYCIYSLCSERAKEQIFGRVFPVENIKHKYSSEIELYFYSLQVKTEHKNSNGIKFFLEEMTAINIPTVYIAYFAELTENKSLVGTFTFFIPAGNLELLNNANTKSIFQK